MGGWGQMLDKQERECHKPSKTDEFMTKSAPPPPRPVPPACRPHVWTGLGALTPRRRPRRERKSCPPSTFSLSSIRVASRIGQVDVACGGRRVLQLHARGPVLLVSFTAEATRIVHREEVALGAVFVVSFTAVLHYARRLGQAHVRVAGRSRALRVVRDNC